MEQRIAALYRELLEAALDCPESFPRIINSRLTELVPSHGIALLIDSDTPATAQTETVAHVRVGGHGDDDPAFVWLENVERGNDLMSKLVTDSESEFERAMSAKYPEMTALHIHWLYSHRNPCIALGICRVETPTNNMGCFTAEDLEYIEQVSPDIMLCVRAYADLTSVRRTGYDLFSHRCTKIATQFGLTGSEQRVLRMLIDGAPNKQIGVELGITLPTVKTHISHILQKTGCRNRADLFGRFFSSVHVVAPH